MAEQIPATGLQLRSLISKDGWLELSLADVALPEPGPDDVLVRIEAAPINPSDLGLLTGPADLSTATQSGTKARPVIRAKVGEAGLRMVAPRMDMAMPVGNEGAGIVVKAGSSPAAQALMGKRVACLGGEMYAEYRLLNVAQIMELPAGTSAREGASCFVNPLTALAMVEVMRREGHKGLVHTAAASNLGQMLVKICASENVPLVTIVRSAEQAALLKGIGAKHIVSTTSPEFMKELIAVLAQTGATLGFDATGGGPLAGQILVAMEAAANLNAKEYSRYGSGQHKQVYIYGRLDLSPTILPPGVGFAWGLGGFLLTPFLQQIGAEGRARLRAQVAAGLKTTFASHYTRELSLQDVLDLETLHAYSRKATGEKYLITPGR